MARQGKYHCPNSDTVMVVGANGEMMATDVTIVQTKVKIEAIQEIERQSILGMLKPTAEDRAAYEEIKQREQAEAVDKGTFFVNDDEVAQIDEDIAAEGELLRELESFQRELSAFDAEMRTLLLTEAA